MTRHTHTIAELVVPAELFDIVHARLKEGGYDPGEDLIDMHGLGLSRGPESSELQRLRNLLVKAGVCPKCGKEIVHDIDEPFAGCECPGGYGEWTSEPPTISLLRHDLSQAVKWTEIVKHSLGIPQSKTPYRDYYCTRKGDQLLESMVRAGIMRHGATLNDGRDQYYRVTEKGAEMVGAKLPKE